MLHFHVRLALAVAIIMLTFATCETAPDQIAKNIPATESAVVTGKTPPDGQAIFRQYCVVCHGADGKLGLNGAKDLSQSTLTLEEKILQITNGKNMMTPFKEILSAEEIKSVAEYTLSLKK